MDDLPARRFVIEVDEETRARLKVIAAKRRLTMKQLLSDLATRAEKEEIQSRGKTD